MKIGDRVICIDNTDSPLIKGREYIVYDVREDCCDFVINVGIVNNEGSTIIMWCGRCGKIGTATHDIGEEIYYGIYRFRKVEEKYRAVRVEVEIEEPILN